MLALKYAQNLYGADQAAVGALSSKLPGISNDLPQPCDFRLNDSRGQLGAAEVLFLGKPPLYEFRYREIRTFSRSVLHILSNVAPGVIRLAMTIHGPGFGLDGLECFESSIAGLLDSLVSGSFPPALTDIAILERVQRRADRFDKALDQLIKSRVLEIDRNGLPQVQFGAATAEKFRSASA